MKRLLITTLFGVLLHCVASAQQIEPITAEGSLLGNYTTSWLANDGGYEEAHIPHDMWNMYVNADGIVATICGWDEGGTNVGVYHNGRLISRPEGSGTGGWGRHSGKAVVIDDQYVYQLLTQHGCDGANSQLNQNGVAQFPPCDKKIEWKTIRRYDLFTGKGAPFKGGYGYKGDMVIVSQDKSRSMEGLAIHGDKLFVSITSGEESQGQDSIKIYNSATMTLAGGYPIKGKAGQIYADNKGGLWMMQGKQIIRLKAMSGEPLPQTITIPEDVEALSFSIDTYNNRLLLPNRGKDMNVLIYTNIYKRPTLSKTFGTTGGIFAHNAHFKSGQAGAYRFSGPSAAGVDSKGNIYIANTSVSGGRGAVVEAYKANSEERLWKCEGLIFTATADFDRSNTGLYYTPEKIHRIDHSKDGVRVDELVAYTADPFRFPDDERVKKDGAFVTSSFKRTIEGKSYLFISDMYGGMLAGYRFDEEKYGYIAVPCIYVNNGDPDKGRKITFWVDLNGDAKRQEEEFMNSNEVNQYSMSLFVDHRGNIWRGTRGQGVMFWGLKGVNSHGVPEYHTPVLYPLPQGIHDAKRVYYDPEQDELFIAGFSPTSPDARDTWWSMGSTIVRCKDFIRKAEAGEFSKDSKADMTLYIPFNIEDGSRRDYTNAKAFTVEGEYIFVAIARYGYITVYDRKTGKFVGRIEPGEEVHRQSGWCDFNYAINAMKQTDGSYKILHEENAFAKVLCYHWRPETK